MKETKGLKLPTLPPLTKKAPKPPAGKQGFTLLGPGGGEIYKVHANYPGWAQVGPCKIWVFWNGGPAGPVRIYICDVWRWQALAVIWSGTNVPANTVGTKSWTIPATFHPTDEWTPKPSWWTPPNSQPGQYMLYITGGGLYAYGPWFNIAWSE